MQASRRDSLSSLLQGMSDRNFLVATFQAYTMDSFRSELFHLGEADRMDRYVLPRLRVTALDLLLMVVSGLLWAGCWLLNKTLLSDTLVATGINLLYLPAGVRLLLVLLFGPWGALGIFLVDPIMFFIEFGTGSPAEVIGASFISDFTPYLAVLGFCRAAGISPRLSGLRPFHLPLLALLVSLVTPFLFNLHFIFYERHAGDDLARNFAAMATGDFLGCFAVLALARGFLAAGRAVQN